MTFKPDPDEKEPAEGSRETVEEELADAEDGGTPPATGGSESGQTGQT